MEDVEEEDVAGAIAAEDVAVVAVAGVVVLAGIIAGLDVTPGPGRAAFCAKKGPPAVAPPLGVIGMGIATAGGAAAVNGGVVIAAVGECGPAGGAYCEGILSGGGGVMAMVC